MINIELFIPDFSKNVKLNCHYASRSLGKKIFFYDLMLKYYHMCCLFCQYHDSHMVL